MFDKPLTFAERLAAQVQADAVSERFPYGQPALADPFSHVADRGYVMGTVVTMAQARKARVVAQHQRGGL